MKRLILFCLWAAAVFIPVHTFAIWGTTMYEDGVGFTKVKVLVSGSSGTRDGIPFYSYAGDAPGADNVMYRDEHPIGEIHFYTTDTKFWICYVFGDTPDLDDGIEYEDYNPEPEPDPGIDYHWKITVHNNSVSNYTYECSVKSYDLGWQRYGGGDFVVPAGTTVVNEFSIPGSYASELSSLGYSYYFDPYDNPTTLVSDFGQPDHYTEIDILIVFPSEAEPVPDPVPDPEDPDPEPDPDPENPDPDPDPADPSPTPTNTVSIDYAAFQAAMENALANRNLSQSEIQQVVNEEHTDTRNAIREELTDTRNKIGTEESATRDVMKQEGVSLRNLLNDEFYDTRKMISQGGVDIVDALKSEGKKTRDQIDSTGMSIVDSVNGLGGSISNLSDSVSGIGSNFNSAVTNLMGEGDIDFGYNGPSDPDGFDINELGEGQGLYDSGSAAVNDASDTIGFFENWLGSFFSLQLPSGFGSASQITLDWSGGSPPAHVAMIESFTIDISSWPLSLIRNIELFCLSVGVVFLGLRIYKSTW
ncbi:MAG: hypothetical protein AB7E95_10125 [Kiritimatiellales bacterium]